MLGCFLVRVCTVMDGAATAFSIKGIVRIAYLNFVRMAMTAANTAFGFAIHRVANVFV